MSNLVLFQNAVALVTELEFCGGQITPEIEQKFIEIAKSADAAGKFLIRSESKLKELQEEKKQISKEIEMFKRAVSVVESELEKSIAAIGDIEGEKFIFKLQKTMDVVVIDSEAMLSDLYLRTKVTHEPNKDAIYDAIKAGQAVDGARLEPNFTLKQIKNTKKIRDVNDV
jgi:seryl-tRNA synthetase